MGLVRHVALTDETTGHAVVADLAATAAALQAQLDRDFTPVWGVRATVVALGRDEVVPRGTWPLRVVDALPGAGGVHLDAGRTPYAQVALGARWTLAASHELLEMLVDPYGHRLVAGPDIDPGSDGHLVHYLVEVADPCEVYGYTIHGVTVSDFVTPEFYNAHAAPGAVPDFLGRLAGPFDVPAGCYLSWTDPLDRRWHQKRPDGSIVTATREVDPQRNPRDDRDDAFAEAGAARLS